MWVGERSSTARRLRRRQLCHRTLQPGGNAPQSSRFAKSSAVEKIRELFTETPNSLRGSLVSDSEYSPPWNSFSKNLSKSGCNDSRVASRLGVSNRSFTKNSLS